MKNNSKTAQFTIFETGKQAVVNISAVMYIEESGKGTVLHLPYNCNLHVYETYPQCTYRIYGIKTVASSSLQKEPHSPQGERDKTGQFKKLTDDEKFDRYSKMLLMKQNGYSNKEISEKFSISENSVPVLLSKGKNYT